MLGSFLGLIVVPLNKYVCSHGLECLTVIYKKKYFRNSGSSGSNGPQSPQRVDMGLSLRAPVDIYFVWGLWANGSMVLRLSNGCTQDWSWIGL